MIKISRFALIIPLLICTILLPSLSSASQIYTDLGMGIGKIQLKNNNKHSYVGIGDIGYPLSHNFSAEIGFNYFSSPKTIQTRHNFSSDIVLKGHFRFINRLNIFGKLGPSYNIAGNNTKYYRSLSALFAAGIETYINHVSISTQFIWITRSMNTKEIPAYLAGAILIGYRF